MGTTARTYKRIRRLRDTDRAVRLAGDGLKLRSDAKPTTPRARRRIHGDLLGSGYGLIRRRDSVPPSIGIRLMSLAAAIRAKLAAQFAPEHIEIMDESAKHAGHAGARPGGESHFRVVIVAAAFRGQSRQQRQRAVYHALQAELAGPVHALALTTLTPEEFSARG